MVNSREVFCFLNRATKGIRKGVNKTVRGTVFGPSRLGKQKDRTRRNRRDETVSKRKKLSAVKSLLDKTSVRNTYIFMWHIYGKMKGAKVYIIRTYEVVYSSH